MSEYDDLDLIYFILDPPGWRPGLTLCSGGCGKWIPCQYCDECAKTAKCPHGNPLDCNDCMIEGDLAFDAERESR
jgi:hypothetical protein